MKNYTDFYEKISAPLQANPSLARGLHKCNRFLTDLILACYPGLLIYLLVRFGPLSHLLWKAAGIPLVTFLLVTLVRHLINRPRPYDTWPITPIIPKEKQGHSLPSRHVFSSAVISMVFLYFFPPVGIIFLVTTVFLALVRVLAGVHYPSDVIAGYLVGVLAGLFMWI